MSQQTPPVTPTPQNPSQEQDQKEQTNPLVERYAAKLKAELGSQYSQKFDAMPVEQRIDAMEAAIEVLSKKPTPPPANTNSGQPPITKPEGMPPGPPPDERKKPLTFVEKQQKEGFKQKLLQRGNYSAIADKLYKKE